LVVTSQFMFAKCAIAPVATRSRTGICILFGRKRFTVCGGIATARVYGVLTSHVLTMQWGKCVLV
jgi:hypothetical protein